MTARPGWIDEGTERSHFTTERIACVVKNIEREAERWI